MADVEDDERNGRLGQWVYFLYLLKEIHLHFSSDFNVKNKCKGLCVISLERQ